MLEIQVFTNFLPVCWQRILLTYSSWQLTLVYCYVAIFYLMNMTPWDNIIFSHYVFSLNSTLILKISFIDICIRKNFITTYVAWLFCSTDLKTNHNRILILALLDADWDGASTATITVPLTFYCISEDNLELKLSWVVDIIWFPIIHLHTRILWN